MAATATKLPLPTATQPTPLARLYAERAQAVDSVKRLTGVSTRLHAEAAAGASLIDELAKLAETETNEMRLWADGGCQGAAPKGKQAERQTIAVKMASTNATAAAARGAIADTDNQLAELNDKLRSISDQIEQEIYDLVEREHGDVIAEYAKLCERGSQLATQISGLALLFRETGNNQRAAAIFTRKLPAVSTNPREVQSSADAWGRRIADLRKAKA